VSYLNLSLDIRQAVRSLKRHRGLVITASLMLGLGIGAAIAMAGIVEHVLLRPLPVRQQDRVLVSWGVFQSSGFGHVPLTHATMRAVAERTQVFERVAGVDYNGVWADVGRVGGRGVPTRLGVVTGELFSTLGVPPLLGRTLTADDDRRGAAPVAVLSEGLWERRYGRDPEVLGRPFEVTNGTFTIVGVVPRDFDLPHGSEAWVTFGGINPDLLDEEAYGTLDLVARLRPGRSADEARRELDRLVTEIDGSQWSADSRLAMTVRPLADVVVGQVRPAIWVLGAAAVLVFLVAVLNLGNLLVVRGLERQREFAIRRAIGASRASLARQVVVESAALVVLGAAVGLALAWAAWRALPAVAPADLPRIEGISANSFVLTVALGIGFFAVAIVSALPALSLREADLQVPRGGDPGSSTTGWRAFAWSGAIAAQVTFAVVTLVASLLLVRTLAQLERLEPGFELDDLGMAQIALLTSDSATVERGDRLVEQLVQRLGAVPGVLGVTTVLTKPLSGTGGWDYGFMTEGQTESQAASNPYLNYEAVMPNYFETLRLPIVRGRGFEEGDRDGAPLVVVVSQTMARQVWPGDDPIGKRIRWPGEEDADQWRTVVGVAADSRYRDLLDPRMTVYVPARQQDWGLGYLLLRTASPFGTLIPSLRQAAREVHPEFDLVNASPMESVLDQPLARPRFNAGVLGFFSIVAVILTALGLYGLTSFVVVQRRREVGIRLALGAESRQIVKLFLRRGLVPVLAGGAAGVGVSLVGGRALASLLYGVEPSDPASLLGAVAGFTLVALAAILFASRRAAGVDPMTALRTD
jgi:putative ABC transport system permease protein